MKQFHRLIAMVLVCLLVVTGCGNPDKADGVVPEKSPGSDFEKTTSPSQDTAVVPSEKEGATQTSESVQEEMTMTTMEDLRQEMDGTSYAFAVAYIGETYAEEKNLDALLRELAPNLCQQMPFLLEIPDENTVDVGYGSIFCIIPAGPDMSIQVHQAVEVPTGEWEYTWEYSNLIYESENGEPILLVSDCFADFPDVQVTITVEGGEIVWYPRLDKYHQVQAPVNAANEPLLWDLSFYRDLYYQIYSNNKEWMRLPTEADLIGNVWGWEGIALYDTLYTTYLLSFAEDGATIRWNDGIDTADHEITKIPWELTYVDEFAVLTLDFGNLAGIRSYNLLYEDEYGWLYTMVDLSAGEVIPGEEIPFRSLEPRSLHAPDPLEMVGSWALFQTEFEGYQEHYDNGACTLTITGQTKEELTISCMDQDNPASNYQNKPLNIRQGVLYYGCGNNSWIATVDYVGMWDTTYTVTLLEDGTLLLQNYWELDGAPMASYAWYRRIN